VTGAVVFVVPDRRAVANNGERAQSDLTLGSPLRAAFRLALYVLFAAVMGPLQAVLLAMRNTLAVRVPMLFHRGCCRILGLILDVRGSLSTARPTLFVSNHSSYLDITVLGAIVPGSFVAKAEVANWPFFGWLAKLQRTVFIDRQRRTTVEQRDSMTQRLLGGDNLILFPEGTSNDGNRILPFRSALFSVAEFRPNADEGDSAFLTVQPVSVAYTHLNGFPLGRGLRPFVAWYGDMDLGGHLWRLASLGRFTAVVEFHAPIRLDQGLSRKALSEQCQRVIAEGVAAALTGHRSRSSSAARPAEKAGDLYSRPQQMLG
jgi:1-acyl-sn-glycerol-3-phosphate acyltransferase